MILVMIVGPSLISQDLRFNALPLYFSRPLRRVDYFLGKLGVVGWFLAMVMIFPSLIAYVLGLLFSLDLSIIPDTLPVLMGSIAYGLLVSLVSGLVILALSSLSRNSRYVALAWLAVVLIGSITALVLEGVHGAQRRQEQYHAAQAERRAQQQAPIARTPQEQAKQFQEQQERQRRMWAEIEDVELKNARAEWGPTVSYMANLARVGQRLLGTDAAWKRFSENQPAEYRARFLIEYMGPQHPWYWSAAILAVVVGIAVCVLNFRVKSLDRLK
jgi:ABC-2 type transport system permease protein